MSIKNALAFLAFFGLTASLAAIPTFQAFDLFTFANAQGIDARADTRPNILVIVADDFGFSDLESYGGDVIAPNLKKLANESSLFTNFHIMPVCSPSRSVLMTGVDVHKNGMGTMDVIIAPNQVGKPGYETYLNDRVTTVAQILKDNGYHTYTTGKWHLGHNIQNWPFNRGFDESYTLLHGGASNWNGAIPISAYDAFWVKNNEKIAYPNGTYSSDLYADELIKMVDKNSNDGKPFYAYLAFQATHWPLHAPSKYIEANEGRYDMGWDALREQRLENQKKLGIFNDTVELGPSWDKGFATAGKWDELTAEEKSYESKKMEVYAAMAQAMDYNIGKVIDHLKKTGQYNNTLIIFTADNGAESEKHDELVVKEDIKKEIDQYILTQNNSEANLGNPDSFFSYGPGWAQASNTPFKAFKGYTTEGGIRVPFILKTPGNSEYKVQDGLTFVADVVPTILEYSGSKYPQSGNNGIQLETLAGNSFKAVLEGKTDKIYKDNDSVELEYIGNKAVFSGNWKALNLGKPFGGDDTWSLYDIKNDPSETNDLASKHPDILDKMITSYNEFANQTQIIAPDFKADTSLSAEIAVTG